MADRTPGRPAPAPPSTTARWPRRAALASGMLAGALVATGLAGWTALHSEAGLRWLLPRVPGLSVQGVQGSLGSGQIGIERLRWSGAAGQLVVDALTLDGLQWQWRPATGQWLGLRASGLQARAVRWTSAPSAAPAQPATLPDSIALPLALQVPVTIGTLQVDSAPPLNQLSLQLDLGADAGSVHRITAVSLSTAGLGLRDGRLQIGSQQPLAMEASLQLTGDATAPLPWQAELQASGPLQRLALSGRLRGGTPADGQMPMAVDLAATVNPLARWPLLALQLRTEALDLSRLASGLPQTGLSGRADLSGGDGLAPQLDLALENRIPGRWNEARLPVRQLVARLQGSLEQPGLLTIDSLTAQTAGGPAPGTEADAGRWQASGRWDGHTLTLDNTLTGLRPQQLDGRAVAMQLDGSIAVTVTGLPSPDPAASAPAGPLSATLVTRLQGQLDGQAEPLSLQAEADLGTTRLDLKRFELLSGAAQAQGQAQVALERQRWTVRSEGSLAAFDPTRWLPGAADAPWRRGPHELNAQWTADVSLADAALAQPLQAWLPLVSGDARLQVLPSRLAGLPLQGQLTVRTEQGSQLDGEVSLAGNRLQLTGRTDLTGSGAADRWQWVLDAPALAALAPLAALHPAGGDWLPLAGQASASGLAQGRWPTLKTQGEAAVDSLQAGPLKLDRARLDWQAEDGLTAPLSASLQLSSGQWGSRNLPSLTAELSGTLASHRLTAQAALPLLPPPALARSLDLVAQRGTRLALQVDGAWTPQAAGLLPSAEATGAASGAASGTASRTASVTAPLRQAPAAATTPGAAQTSAAQGGRWTGSVRSLEVAGWNGEVLPAEPSGRPWAQAKEVGATLDFGATGQLLQARLDAGRLTLAGGPRLRWDEAIYGGPSGRITLKASVENLQAAALLARWQPEVGWAGDLEVGVDIDIQAAERFDADIVIERRGGDLSVQDGVDKRLALGLTDLRLAMNAHDGTWYFTQALAGRTLGEAGGAIRLRTTPERRWPEPQAPLDGAVQARVANLGVWGAWVPPGWRLQGELATQAQFGGSLGAPEVTGRLAGSGLGARNLLLGVNVRDGEVAVRLDGQQATVENFLLRAGDGTLRLTGGATLGAQPSVKLAMTADKLQVLGRIDRRLVVSGQGSFLLDPAQLVLDGQLRVDSGLFDASQGDAPTLDEDVVVRRADTPPPAPDTAAAPATNRRVDVQVTVDLGTQLQLRGRGLETRLAGQLQVTAPQGKLAINGTVNTVSGTYAAYGQKMVIERGQVAFSGPPGNPRLDVLALRPKLDVEVGVEIIGSVHAPRVRLYSNPAMSDTDKLSWLVLGRAPGAAGRADTALLQRAAVALLSGEGESGTDKAIRKLGLDELSVRQSDDAAQETVVSLGKQITDRWYVGYERSVNATEGTWQVIYRAARRFTLRLESGLDQSLDAIWVWEVP